MSLIARTVPDQLQPWVRRIAGFYDDGPGISHREMLVVGCPLMFTFESSFGLSERRSPDRITTTRRSFFAGMFDTYTISRSNGRTSCLQVDLNPLGAYQLLGFPMHELSNQVIHIEDLPGPGWRDIVDRLGNLGTWNERFALVERFLLEKLSDLDRVSPEIRWAWTRMMESGGTVPVSRLTEELQWSRKRLRTAFLDEVGFPAKVVERMIRCRCAVDLVKAEPRLPWAQVAVAAGYTDQAHLHRDVRAFTGITPGELRRSWAD